MTNEQLAEWLYDGAVAVCAGDKERARELLLQVIAMDEQNEEAWLWLSGAVDDLEDMQVALENVQHINPHSQPAQMGLAWIARQKR